MSLSLGSLRSTESRSAQARKQNLCVLQNHGAGVLPVRLDANLPIRKTVMHRRVQEGNSRRAPCDLLGNFQENLEVARRDLAFLHAERVGLREDVVHPQKAASVRGWDR